MSRFSFNIVLCIILIISLSSVGAQTNHSRQSVIRDANEVALRSRDAQERAISLAEVAVAQMALDTGIARITMDRAIECARGADDYLAQALAFRSVALRIIDVDAGRASELVNEGANIGLVLPSVTQRSIALREISAVARQLGVGSPDEWLAEALKSAQAEIEPEQRAELLIRLAESCATDKPEIAMTALAECWGAIENVVDPELSVVLLVEAVTIMAMVNPAESLSAVQWIPEGPTRDMTAAEVARRLALQHPDLAFTLTGQAFDGLGRARIMAAISTVLPEEFSAYAVEFINSALSVVKDADGPVAEAARADLAIACTSRNFEQAVELAQSLTTAELHDKTVATMAIDKSTRDASAAAELLTSLNDSLMGEDAAAVIAPRLAASDLDAAFELAKSIISRRLEVRALLQIAATLPLAVTDTTGE